MRRNSIFLLALAAVVFGCGDDPATGVLAYNYSLVPPSGGIAVGQDSTVAIGVDVMRSGTDTTIKNVRLLYASADAEVAVVDADGLVTGVKGGTTTIRVSGPGTTVDVPVTVRGHPATSVELTVLSGPAGGRLATQLDTGTFYALPADPNTSRLRAVVRVGTDTVFCNYCAAKTPARVQRVVRFRSLDETLATVTNATNPKLQTSTDLTGNVTALDTSSAGVRIVLEVPSDGIADTVLLRLKLRPIDTLRIRPDSAFFPTSNGTGLSKQIYPNSDTIQANVIQSSTTNFVAGVTFLSRVQDRPVVTSNTNPAARYIPIQPTGNVNVRRQNLPGVEWESANDSYLTINAAGALVAPCAFIGGACPTTGSTVLTCNSSSGSMPASFAGVGNYTIPSCTPTKNIPFPGALCTSNSSADQSSICSIWIRATAIDQATGKVLRRLYRVNVRR